MYHPFCLSTKTLSTQGLTRNDKSVRQQSRSRSAIELCALVFQDFTCAIFEILYISHQLTPTARSIDGLSQKSQNSERAKPIQSGHVIVSFGASGVQIGDIFEIP